MPALPHTRVRNGIIEYQRLIPVPLRLLCGGKSWFIKSTKQRTMRDAKPRWSEIDVEYEKLITGARAALASNGSFKGTARQWWFDDWGPRVSVNWLSFGPPGSYMPVPGQTTEREIPINGRGVDTQRNHVNTLAPCPTAVVLPLWAADRDQKPKPRSIRNKRGKMAALFTFLDRPDDLTQVTEDDLQRYKEHLLKIGQNVASDHLKDIRSIFAAAKANKKLTVDPAKELRVPPRRPKVTRPGFDDSATRCILEAADQREPIVRWGCWLGATLGLITSEFSDASCLDVEIIDDIPVLHIRPNHRIVIGEDGEQQGDLKTGFRSRTLPLHHKMAAGFLDHVAAMRRQYGEDAGLFAYVPINRDGVRTVNASSKIMKLIRDMGFEAPWCHYSFRHRIATILEGMPEVKPARQRYILGHARADVHETYMEHQPAVLKPIIDAIAVG